MLRPGKRGLGTSWVVFAAVLTCVVALLGSLNGLGRVDAALLDFMATLRTRPAPQDVVIVAIDDASLEQLGQWPWPRRRHARLLDSLMEAKPAAIGLDILLAEPSGEGVKDDAELVQAIGRSGKVVLPVAMSAAMAGGPRASLPTPALVAQAAAIGHVDIELDPDGVARRVFLREGQNSQWWDTFGLALARLAGRAPEELQGERRPAAAAPSDSSGLWSRDYRVQISYAGPPGHFRTLSYADVLAKRFDPDDVRGKIVLVGTTATGLSDAYPTPMSGHSRLMPGVEIHANVLDVLLRRVWVAQASAVNNAFFCVVPLLLALLAFRYLAPARCLAVLPLLLLGTGAAQVLAFQLGRIQFAPAAALIGLLAAYALWSWFRLAAAVAFLHSEINLAQSADAIEDPEAHEQEAATPRRPADLLEHSMVSTAQASRRLRELQRFIRTCVSAMADAIVVVGHDDCIVLANAAAERLLGDEDRGELLGREWNGLVRAQFRSNPMLTLGAGSHSASLTETGFEVEVTSAGARDYLVKVVPWRRHARLDPRWIISLVDLTEVRAAQRARDEAMRFISHDLRSPQASILATLATWNESGVSPADAVRIARIESCARRTLALADEFTHLARVEERALSLVPLDLADALVHCVDEFWEVAQRQKVRLQSSHPDEPCWCLGDRAAMLRALGNLVSNALKFSPPGGTVRCELKALSDRQLEIAVIDEGPGIAPEDHGKLFQRFQRMSPDGVHRDGVGLGLAFVKAAATAHSAEVGVASKPGHGACFYIRIPRLDGTLTTNHREAFSAESD